MKTRKEELMQELEMLRAELNEKSEAITKEEIAGFKVSGVSFYSETYQYITLQHPDFREQGIDIYNGEIKELSVASFSIRNTKEPKEVVEAFAKHLEKMKTIENLIQNPERIKKFYDSIKSYHSENVMPLIKKEYQLESQIKEIEAEEKRRAEETELERMKKELLEAGEIYLFQSAKVGNTYFRDMVFSLDRKGVVVLKTVSGNSKRKLPNDVVKYLYKHIFSMVKRNEFLENYSERKFFITENRITKEQYNDGYHTKDLVWKEVTKEESSKIKTELGTY